MKKNPGASLARYIDHTSLKPDVTREQIERLCDEAKKFHFASVCVNPCWIALAARRLRGSGVKVCAVVGFPLGANAPATKAFEARRAAADGADELDMVLNVGALKSGDGALVSRDIRAVRAAARSRTLKVIVETSLLSREEKVRACRIAKKAGADFVKTSTGFAGGGATAADVRLLRAAIGPRLGVKASGGIRDAKTAAAMIAAGATRLGTSAGAAIALGGRESRGC